MFRASYTPSQWLLTCLFSMAFWAIQAQISGTVFADYNASGTRTTANPTEPLVAGVVVNVYNAAGVLLASYTTTNGSGAYPFTGPNYSIPASGIAYNGVLGSNTGFVASGTAVRLEFTLSATGCTADNNLYSGQGSSSVQFITAPSTTVLYGINNPVDYNTGTGTARLFVPCYVSGDPLGGGSTGSADWFVGYPYTNTGTSTAPSQKLNGTVIGSNWGVAYSKQANRIFTSALVKRQSGLGIMGSGGIYMLEPTATSFNVTQFFDMDNNTFNTASNPVTRSRADAANAPAYGANSSYFLNSGISKVTYLGATDPLTGQPAGLGVVGTNVQRGLSASATAASHDPAAFDQVGKVGLGDIDISDDGKFLFVMNLYSRKVFRLELNSATNPTSVVAVTSYNLPTVTVTNGELRPWATKFYKGKLYVGAVASGEYETSNTENANLRAYVFELNNATGTASFNTTPILNYPLNFTKGYSGFTNGNNKWFPWRNDVNQIVRQEALTTFYYLIGASPILSDIEFNERGDLLMNFADRNGLHAHNLNFFYLASNTTVLGSVMIGGDLLIAGKNCPTGYSIENNGAISSNGVNFNSGAANNQGPGNSEFFKGEGVVAPGHEETSMGAMAILYGTNNVAMTMMDPINLNSGGAARLSTINGSFVDAYQLYTTGNGQANKGIGLGDLELFTPLAPLEIGNRVWADTDADGVQDADESGIGSVTIELYADFDNNGTPDGAALATTTTSTTAGNALGTWYFNTANVTDGDPSTSGSQAGPQPNKRYLMRIGSADWAAGTGSGDLLGKVLTTADVGGTGQPDVRDNDAALSAAIPTISYLTGNAGENNHNLDFGFKVNTCVSDSFPICSGESYTLSTPAGLTDIQWYKNGTLIAGANSQHYITSETGFYNFTATDAGCSYAACCAVVLFEGSCCVPLTLTMSTTPETCGLLADGTAIATASAGTAPYTYAWSNGASGATISALTDGTYTVTATDANGCTGTTQITVTASTCDFGDLPDPTAATASGDYQTLLANSGPYHVVFSGLYLGGGVDGETNGQQSINADGDGTDEDGFPVGMNINWAIGNTISLPFEAVNTTGSPAYLEGWIDWNADGDFNDSGETIANVTVAAGGVYEGSLPVVVPIGAATGQPIGVRFRLSNTDGLAATGAATTGEVEDYMIVVTCPPSVCIPLEVNINSN